VRILKTSGGWLEGKITQLAAIAGPSHLINAVERQISKTAQLTSNERRG
jgi:hypothetical protein